MLSQTAHQPLLFPDWNLAHISPAETCDVLAMPGMLADLRMGKTANHGR